MRNRTLVPDQSGPAAPICWQREAPSPRLRVELADDEIHLLAYQHFVSAALTRGSNGNETLLVMFSTHELAIDGQGLRELLLCLQDYAVKWLRAFRSVTNPGRKCGWNLPHHTNQRAGINLTVVSSFTNGLGLITNDQ